MAIFPEGSLGDSSGRGLRNASLARKIVDPFAHRFHDTRLNGGDFRLVDILTWNLTLAVWSGSLCELKLA